jgi:hypothetical protein
MAKAIECYIRLHGRCREIPTSEFPSIAAAKQWVRDCWNRPYTIVKGKPPKINFEVSN